MEQIIKIFKNERKSIKLIKNEISQLGFNLQIFLLTFAIL